jgi:2-methylcitrate dehydratase PrpD
MAAQQLVLQSELSIDEISAIRVRTFAEAVALHPGYPSTTDEAQFSLAWPLACLLIDGEIGPSQILEHHFGDTRVRRLVDKIEIVLDPEIEALYKASQEMDLRMHSRVELTTRDGRRLDSGIVERGADRYTDEDLDRKFRWLAGHVLPDVKIDALVEVLRRFDKLANVRELVSYL